MVSPQVLLIAVVAAGIWFAGSGTVKAGKWVAHQTVKVLHLKKTHK